MNHSTRLKHYRLSPSEYELMTKLLGREPRPLEWPLFSALWSEHCSYKSSKIHLKKFKYKNERVLESEGENAGVVDLGLGEKIAFKMESHNHPSFIEPYQGAATGVGGILRDIFTMGARPIALSDYLCFGEIDAARMQSLTRGVVAGISGYGNCVGVPTVTGATFWEKEYNQNILVNAMAVGLFVEDQKIAISRGSRPGHHVIYVGARTGKDGVHGAAMASESFESNNEAKKPNVQIGDPFYEKLLIEACLEVLEKELVVSMQDMGAAGLTSSSFEMASKGQVGMTLYLDQVPVRDATITPEEILLSESQERMLIVCEPQQFAALRAVFEKWGLEASKIGEVTEDRKVKILWKQDCLVEVDPDLLVENAPRYERAFDSWQAHSKSDDDFEKNKNQSYSVSEYIDFLTSQLHYAKRDWIYEQYDQRVGLMTTHDARESVAFLKLPSGRRLSLTVGCQPLLMKLDAQVGAYEACFGPALNMAIKGSQIIALTDCLNFGNPENKKIMSEFVVSVESIAHASELLDAPVVSGNVSFYNETLGQSIISTPAVGAIGLSEDEAVVPADSLKQVGLTVLRVTCPSVKTCLAFDRFKNKQSVYSGSLRPESIARFIRMARRLQQAFSVSTARRVEQGGLLFTLMKICQSGVGFKASGKSFPELSELICENMFEYIVALAPSDAELYRNEVLREGNECTEIGRTTADPVLDLGVHGVFSAQDIEQRRQKLQSQMIEGGLA